MLEKDFQFLTKQFGKLVTLNDEEETRKEIITNATTSKTMPSFDDKKIHSQFEIKRGDVITYNNVPYLIITDIQSKREFEYKATMRPMINNFPISYWTEGEYYYDRMGNKVYTVKPEEVIKNIPCIIYQDSIPAILGGAISVIDERIKVIMPDTDDTDDTDDIERGSKHELHDIYYKVTDINTFQKGLRIFTMEWTTA